MGLDGEERAWINIQTWQQVWNRSLRLPFPLAASQPMAGTQKFLPYTHTDTQNPTASVGTFHAVLGGGGE